MMTKYHDEANEAFKLFGKGGISLDRVTISGEWISISGVVEHPTLIALASLSKRAKSELANHIRKALAAGGEG